MLVALCTVVAGGCTGSSPSHAVAPAPPPSPAVPWLLAPGCGIEEAHFNGQWYWAVEPLPDGNGDYPIGWDNTVRAGTMRVISVDHLEFADRYGYRLRFRLRPGATAPHQVCA